MKKEKVIVPTRMKTIILSIAIAIILSAFVIYFINAVYPRPSWEDFCGGERTALKGSPQTPAKINQTACTNSGGNWIDLEIRCIQAPCPEEQGYCDYYKECQEDFEAAANRYKLTVFLVSIIVGMIALVAGIILTLPSVSSGLMIGGTFLTIFGTLFYWTNLNNILKAIILGLVLFILIWVGYKKLGN
ncbi:hypothetical protein GOV14_02750 [Candidatus Pacearchaeota archaeon]|nr:hypothetical protein [Candidatus Pacearchaeota archaeon]